MTKKQKAITYYAVAVGRRAGVYRDLDEASRQIRCYPNARMKKFKNINKARLYVKDGLKDRQDIKKQREINTPTIYIDGSYDQNKGVAGYGYIVRLKNEFKYRDCGTVYKGSILHDKSQGAELHACLRAIEWCIANEHEDVIIVYDFAGILHAVDGFGKKSKSRDYFRIMYKKYARFINIKFIHKNINKEYKKNHQHAHNLSRLPLSMLIS